MSFGAKGSFTLGSTNVTEGETGNFAPLFPGAGIDGGWKQCGLLRLRVRPEIVDCELHVSPV